MNEPLAGETWRIHHVRKGDLTVRFTEDYAADSTWAHTELVDGQPRYASITYRLGEMGAQDPGDSLTIRKSLFELVEPVAA